MAGFHCSDHEPKLHKSKFTVNWMCFKIYNPDIVMKLSSNQDCSCSLFSTWTKNGIQWLSMENTDGCQKSKYKFGLDCFEIEHRNSLATFLCLWQVI